MRLQEEGKELMQNYSNLNKIRIETLGCRLNQVESEAAASLFIKENFNVDLSSSTANEEIDKDVVLCILNTCTVTQKAEQKARRIIRLMLKKYPNASILVTGCYAQLSKEEILKIDQRICVLGGQIKSRIEDVPLKLKNALQTQWDPLSFSKEVQTQVSDRLIIKKDFSENPFKLTTNNFIAHSRPSLKIQDGCNSSCSYCAIHFARGKSVSLDVELAVERVKELEDKGYPEVVLTCVNIAQYKGKYQDKYFNFSKLLEKLLQSTEKINFRISSLYPQIVDDEFCRVIASPRVRPFFHISVQSGSDKILSLMNRDYNADAVRSACKKIRESKNNPFIACDIITGFPGESKEDFEQTMQLCRDCNFSWVHAFPFSERKGTLAVSLKNKVPQEVSGQRAKELTQWAINQKINYINQWCQKELDAVLETKKNPKALSANNNLSVYHLMTENFIHCEIQSSKVLEMNKAVKIRIIKPLNERITKGGEIEALAELI